MNQTNTYTYLKLKDSVFNVKEENKTIPQLEFQNTWKFRLQTLDKFNKLWDSEKLTKGKYYYKLKDSNQVASRGWNELKRLHFKNTEHMFWDTDYLDKLLKRKKIPKLYFNSICYFDWDDELDYKFNVDDLEFKYLEFSNEVPVLPKNDIEKVDLNDKNQLVLDYVKEMEFQHDEVLSLIVMLTTSLAEKEYNC